MKVVPLHPPRPDYDSAAYLIFCLVVTVAWVCTLAYFGRKFLESLPL